MPQHLYTLICESVRPELNGKITLIGTYGSGVFVQVIPTQLQSFGIYQRWRASQNDPPGTKILCRMEGHLGNKAIFTSPDQEVVIRPIPFNEFNIVADLRGFPIEAEGEYSIETFFDGKLAHRFVFSVQIPTPKDQEILKQIAVQS